MASFHHLKRQSDTGTPMDGPGEVSSGNLGAAGRASSDLGETITLKVRLNTGKEHSWSGGSNTQVRRRVSPLSGLSGKHAGETTGVKGNF